MSKRRTDLTTYHRANQESSSDEEEEETPLNPMSGNNDDDDISSSDGDDIEGAAFNTTSTNDPTEQSIQIEMTAVHPEAVPLDDVGEAATSEVPVPVVELTEDETQLQSTAAFAVEENAAADVSSAAGDDTTPPENVQHLPKYDEICDAPPPSYADVEVSDSQESARVARYVLQDIPAEDNEVATEFELSTVPETTLRFRGTRGTREEGVSTDDVETPESSQPEEETPLQDVDVEAAVPDGDDSSRVGEEDSSSEGSSVEFRLFQYIRSYHWGPKSIIAAITVVCLILFIILMLFSLSYLEYFEMGFKMRKAGKTVFYMEEVFKAGAYFIGPRNTFKSFPAVAHTVHMPDLYFFTTDPLRMSIDCHFHYFLRTKDLGLLENEFDKDYHQAVEKVAFASIKNTVTLYSLDNFLEVRSDIEREIHKNLRVALQGDCCTPFSQCQDFTSCEECSSGTDSNCTRGYHVEVPFFNLLGYHLPQVILTRKELVLVTALEGEEEVFRQMAAVTRITTERMVQDIHNDANFLAASASATAAKIRSVAKTEANAIVDTANSQGLTAFYASLSITTQDHKASAHWLRTLKNHQNLILGVDFEEYMLLMNHGVS